MRRLAAPFMVLIAACGTADPTTTAAAPRATTTAPVVTAAPPPVTTADPEPTPTEPSTTAPTPTTVATTTTVLGVHAISATYAGGEVTVEGSLEIERGADVVITVTSDVADEAHLHGYDLFADVDPGRPAQFAFVADRQGIFELELEDARLPLLQIEVR